MCYPEDLFILMWSLVFSCKMDLRLQCMYLVQAKLIYRLLGGSYGIFDFSHGTCNK